MWESGWKEQTVKNVLYVPKMFCKRRVFVCLFSFSTCFLQKFYALLSSERLERDNMPFIFYNLFENFKEKGKHESAYFTLRTFHVCG